MNGAVKHQAGTNQYLAKHRFCEPQISTPPHPETHLIVVVPCHNEPDLEMSLRALMNCKKPESHVEIIVVINAPEDAPESVIKQNNQTLQNLSHLQNESADGIDVHFIVNNRLPKKHAGVGLARKIGMDEAVARFDAVQNDEGIIVCFDADCTCDRNYLQALEQHFKEYVDSPACSIYFEHPLSGNKYKQEVYDAIVQYELFLRYYRQGLLLAGFPYAFHTIGSCMAVRSKVYQQQGGMNKRKAGEDFYFLQKLIPLGGFSELNLTRVIPSPRPSDRVPFGTGKAVNEWLQDQDRSISVYHPQTFLDLKALCECASSFWNTDETENLPHPVQKYFNEIGAQERIVEIRNNTTTPDHFVKRFYQWFNAFHALKYAHFARDHYYGLIEVTEATRKLLTLMDNGFTQFGNELELLHFYRKLDQQARA